MNSNYNQRAKKILSTIQYATVATVTADGKPWNSPVAHEIDDKYNIYWFSDKESQHSKNIQANPDAFIIIYDSTVPEGTGEGVYIEADVIEVNDPEEINKVRNRKKGIEINDAQEFLGDGIRRCYKAIPKRMWINDLEKRDGKFVRDYRVELNLK